MVFPVVGAEEILTLPVALADEHDGEEEVVTVPVLLCCEKDSGDDDGFVTVADTKVETEKELLVVCAGPPTAEIVNSLTDSVILISSSSPPPITFSPLIGTPYTVQALLLLPLISPAAAAAVVVAVAVADVAYTYSVPEMDVIASQRSTSPAAGCEVHCLGKETL